MHDVTLTSTLLAYNRALSTTVHKSLHRRIVHSGINVQHSDVAKELGVLLAIGMKPRQLSLMVMLEGFFLGLLGSILGLGLGYLACYPLVTNGLDMTAQMGESYDAAGVTISAMIYGAYHWPAIISYAILAALFSTLSAVYPAWRITKLKPVDAMRHH